jgi:hypothetical protein
MTQERSDFVAEIVEAPPQPTVAVRIQQPMAELDLSAAFDRYPGEVAARVVGLGGALVGPPYARYHRFGPDLVDVEIGFPVAAPLSGLPALEACPPGEIGASLLGGGPIARTTHRGPYDGLSGTYERLHEWIHAQPGYDDGPGPWEAYLDDPGSTPDAEVRTEISWPLVPG